MSLLEINILSAHDLPPVSKMLRTFAVAYMHPDHKLTTKVDHQGHTNPTWNYKVVFHVEDKFLKQESSSVTIEIYNVAWLRDLPIGTTRLVISNLNPPLHKNPSFRRVSLQICRPSGHLQGTINLGVQFIQSTVLGRELNVSGMKTDEEILEEDQIQDQDIRGNDYIVEEYLKDHEKNTTPKDETPISLISKDHEKNSVSHIKSNPISPMRPKSEAETRSFISSKASLFSQMRSLPSEVAKEMKRGLYSTDWQEYGSSVFENWTESGDKDEDILALQSKWTTESREKDIEDITHVVKSKWTSESGDKDVEDHMLLRTRSLNWRPDDPIPRKSDKKKKQGLHKKNISDTGKGLMSCFGNAYGFQFSFICGSKAMKKKKKSRTNFHKMNVPEENIHMF